MPRTNYNSPNCKDVVFNLAKPIRGCDPDKYRQDPYGNKICYNSYGKHTPMGWEIDHIRPQSRGGGHDISNLQALQSSVNHSKQDTLVKKSRHYG